MSAPKLHSRRGRDERYDAMSAAAAVIVQKKKAAQDTKTEKLRKLREARDSDSPVSVKADSKKRKTSR